MVIYELAHTNVTSYYFPYADVRLQAIFIT